MGTLSAVAARGLPVRHSRAPYPPHALSAARVGTPRAWARRRVRSLSAVRMGTLSAVRVRAVRRTHVGALSAVAACAARRAVRRRCPTRGWVHYPPPPHALAIRRSFMGPLSGAWAVRRAHMGALSAAAAWASCPPCARCPLRAVHQRCSPRTWAHYPRPRALPSASCSPRALSTGAVRHARGRTIHRPPCAWARCPARGRTSHARAVHRAGASCPRRGLSAARMRALSAARAGFLTAARVVQRTLPTPSGRACAGGPVSPPCPAVRASEKPWERLYTHGPERAQL
ncbi:hypothetical protein GGX14DRAFT_635809 [Mycena pura]|uniref:Uncharacterized protein n=1 Tax=Mycena pura TaxID=153505 RepID=A0AAD6VI23_9AGAR|nr:hypothetical protein GGX14DRAFT_635809 [Mycena pura]